MTDRHEELAILRAENARLISLLEAHGITWQVPSPGLTPSASLALDVTFVTDEELHEPWKRPSAHRQRLVGAMPHSLTLTLANLIYIKKDAIPQVLLNRLIRLATFANPEFHRSQALRLPVWNKPRLIGCADNFPRHIALPRGCLDAVCELLHENNIGCELQDKRYAGQPLAMKFAGQLREDQEQAVRAMLSFDTGILCAPTAFGKTVTAAALIARRGVNTLVLVHRTELLRQWQERLQTFLACGKDAVGVIGAGSSRPTGQIDHGPKRKPRRLRRGQARQSSSGTAGSPEWWRRNSDRKVGVLHIAVMQSIHRRGETSPVVENYGHVIVDECHHLSAASFEAILKHARARYVLGLTATPIRRDGHQPILFMQCGPIRHAATDPPCCDQAGGCATDSGVSAALPAGTCLIRGRSRHPEHIPSNFQRCGPHRQHRR